MMCGSGDMARLCYKTGRETLIRDKTYLHTQVQQRKNAKPLSTQ